MRRKKLLSFVVVLTLMLGMGTFAFAANDVISIPYLNYTVQDTLAQNDHVTYFYQNKTANTTQSVNFRISDKDLSSNAAILVAGKLSGEFLVYYPDGTRVVLGTISGSNLYGEFNNLPPGAYLIVNLGPATGAGSVDYKIRFDGQ